MKKCLFLAMLLFSASCEYIGDSSRKGQVEGEKSPDAGVDAGPMRPAAVPTDFCPDYPIPVDSDGDCDGVPTGTDNCEQGQHGFEFIDFYFNPDQINSDTDAMGDACDPCDLDPANDIDQDEVCGDVDNCPAHHNTNQSDVDDDGFGDVCDQGDGGGENALPTNWPDVNCNGISSAAEGTCQGRTVNLLGSVTICTSLLPNSMLCDDYVDTTAGNGTAAICNAGLAFITDADKDGWGNDCDNCDNIYNPSQTDGDNDGIGDRCDQTP